MFIRKIILGTLLVFLLTSVGMAQYLARESFDYAVGSSIDTLMGGATNGWAGSWYKIAANQANALMASDTGLPYEDLNYPIANVGNHLESVPDTLGTEQRYGRLLDKTWPNEAGTTYWISFLMDVKNATDNSTWLGVKLFYGETGELCMFGKGHGLDKYTVGSGWHGGAGAEVSDVTWDTGPVWLVGKVVMQGSASTDYDTTYMWINPDPAGGEPDIATANGVANTSMKNGINTIRVEFGGSVGTTGLSVSYDELRLGTSWGEVASDIYLARESFDYAVGSSIDTLMGGATNGWAGSWYKIAANQANALMASDTGLPYEDLNYPIANVGNHLESVPDTLGTEQRYGRLLDKTWPNEAGTTYWISFLMDVKNATDNSTWLGVKLFYGETGELCMFGKGHGLDKYTVGSGWHGGAGAEVSDVTWDTGPVWLVGKVVMQGSASTDYDTTYMWINPDPAGGEPDIATANGVANTSMKNGINTIRVEFGGSVGTTGLSVSYDELRLGTSWGDASTPLVTDVPWDELNLPSDFTLSQNYPNPFNPSTRIIYILRTSGKVRLTISDLLGREVAVLVDEEQIAGSHDIQFNAANLSSGIYFYSLQSSSGVVTKKMVFLK